MSSDHPSLSRAELEQFDPRARAGASRQRFCCPICGDAKPLDAGHRSLSLERSSGLWKCHRCGNGGKLQEYRDERPSREKARYRPPRIFAAPRAAPPLTTEWRQHLNGLQGLANTPGAHYLASRGVPPTLAHAAGARYCADWFGRPAVVFPIRNRAGELVAAHGRYCDGRTDPKSRTAGHASAGTFTVPGAWEADTLILVEAPICALSLAACGYPAVATLGCSLPDSVAWACALRRVLVATDADDAGDNAAKEWIRILAARGATVRRMRPRGAKDWNELMIGASDRLRQGLAVLLPREQAAPSAEDPFAAISPPAPATTAPRANVARSYVDATVA